MDKSGIVTYKCKIDGRTYVISINAGVSEYRYDVNGIVFSSIIDCVNSIDERARSRTFFGPEI